MDDARELAIHDRDADDDAPCAAVRSRVIAQTAHEVPRTLHERAIGAHDAPIAARQVAIRPRRTAAEKCVRPLTDKCHRALAAGAHRMNVNALARRPEMVIERARARLAVARAEVGYCEALELSVPPRPVLALLLDEGALERAILLLERDGDHGRIAVSPRRAAGPPKIAEVLEEDHRRLDDLAERMRSTVRVDPVHAVVLAHLFARGLMRHIDAEEKLLFPMYEARMGHGAVRATSAMAREHAAIRHHLERLLSSAERVLEPSTRVRGFEDFLCADRALTAVLADHNEKEERTLFPLLDRTTTDAERQEILRRIVLY
jgi:iron-sulfur cluster repair protein YtfE (RIC family)